MGWLICSWSDVPSPDYLQLYDLDIANYRGPVDWKHIVGAVTVVAVSREQVVVVVVVVVVVATGT
jgi:hypothetical protein